METGWTTPQTPAVNGRNNSNIRGCATFLLLIGVSLWVLFLSVLGLLSGWIIEQGLFDGSLGFPDLRWLAALIVGAGLVFPLLVLSKIIKDTQQQSIYHTWLLAAIWSLLCFPIRFLPITAFQSVSSLQILILGVFLVLIEMRRRKFTSKIKIAGQKPSSIGIGVSLGLLTGIPWTFWGALGSVLDSLLGLATGLLTGFLASWLLEHGLMAGVTPSVSDGDDKPVVLHKFTRGKIALLGYTGCILMIILITGVAMNGNQWIVLTTVPVTAIPGTFLLVGSESRSKFWAVAALAGITTAWPLMWMDPDELMLVSSLGPGELMALSFRAAFFTVVILLLMSLVIFGLRHRLRVLELSVNKNLTLIGISGLLLFGTYFLWGTPGFYGEKWFVILNSQADLTQVNNIASYKDRRQFVYDHLVEHAEASQREIRRSLERWGIDYKPYYLVNGLEVHGGPVIRAWLENHPDVERVLPNPQLRPLPNPPKAAAGTATKDEGPDWNLTMIHAEKVWEMGYRGEGILIGQSDSGVQGNHPELADSYRGRNGTNERNWYDPWNHSAQPVDIGGHGTHTLGTILGNTVGVAPDAEWIGCVNLARNLANPAFYLDCWQFSFAPFPQNGDPFRDGDPRNGAMVLNNSWGCPEVEGCDAATFASAVKALRAAGIFTVVSAGNAGLSGCGSVKDPPAIYDEVYSVGVVNSSGSIANFSSLGPVSVDGSNRVKPDILAPGERVLSAYPGNSYEVTSGTSMAGPHVAGVVTLIWSANPGLIGDVATTEKLINQTASYYSGWEPGCDQTADAFPKNGSGYGLIDAHAAVKAALELIQR